MTPVMNKYFPGFYSGDWIFDELRLRGLNEQIAFIDELDVDLIQPYVLFAVMRIVVRDWAPAFHQRAEIRLLKTFDADEIARILALPLKSWRW